MAHYTRREAKQLKQDAKEFAGRAQAGRPYWFVCTIQGGTEHGTRLLKEIEFKKKFGVGLMWGSFDPAKLYEIEGRIYEDRNHPDIRGLMTFEEQTEYDLKWNEAYLNGQGHYEAVRQSTAGTNFHSTW